MRTVGLAPNEPFSVGDFAEFPPLSSNYEDPQRLHADLPEMEDDIVRSAWRHAGVLKRKRTHP